ncbi:MAG: LVIVD repeat-containing protein [Longimicrobiales bacterium]
MRFDVSILRPAAWMGVLLWSLCLATGSLVAPEGAGAQTRNDGREPDPRVDLGAGFMDAEEAASNLELVAHRPRPEGFFNPEDPGDFGFSNTDLAFSGEYVFQGSYNGFQVWDISDPSSPRLRAAVVCPGGQGDVSVYDNLLFMSVEQTSGRLDCGGQGVADSVSAERFRGVRIFDISDLDDTRQVAAVQTCRGSHTHTLVTDPEDDDHVYIYVSGTSVVRSPSELAGCSPAPPEEDPNTSLFRIEIIRVPVASPQDAHVIGAPRIFADTAGNIAGLWAGGSHGEGTQRTARTDECHDITVYSELGLAAGACSGNGILLDISDPANPARIAQVSDPNFAYWHSATFSNDGDKVLFSDEWGGGTQPRCRETDPPQWGANAIFTRAGDRLRPAGYYKLPPPQTAQENCVAHNGSLIPVPGRDIMVQAWYQGGVSVFDFTDPANPVEIAFFDRGPMSETELMLGGYWSAYWYNGLIVASEIGRGLDIFELTPSQYLSENEIEAAKLVRFERFNPQDQPRLVWPASFVVARAYLDGLVQSDGLRRSWAEPVARELERAERLSGSARQAALAQLATQLERDAETAAASDRVRALAAVVRELAS